MKTYVATPATRERNWLVVDANGQTLADGRYIVVVAVSDALGDVQFPLPLAVDTRRSRTGRALPTCGASFPRR